MVQAVLNRMSEFHNIQKYISLILVVDTRNSGYKLLSLSQMALEAIFLTSKK